MISFSCDFPMVAKERPRLGRGGRTYTPTKTKGFEDAVAFKARAAMGNQPPMATPCRVEIYALVQIPPSWPKWKQAAAAGKPYTSQTDWDNQGKAVCDALNGVVYVDDRLVAHGSVERYWSPNPDQFRVTILPLAGVPKTRAEAQQELT